MLICTLRALLTSELEEVFANAPAAPNSMAHNHVREAYARATGKAVHTEASSNNDPKKRMPEPDDDCPVCYEGLHGVSEKQLSFCESCGNFLHKQCFDQCTSSPLDIRQGPQADLPF